MNPKTLAALATKSPDAALLRELELEIAGAFHRSFGESRRMGKAFAQIKEQQLYNAVGIDTWTKYLQERFGADTASVERVITSSRIADRIEHAGLELPERTRDAQMLELAKLEPDQQIRVWQDCLGYSQRHETVITAKLVRTAIDLVEQKLAEMEEKKASGAGVQTPLEDNGEEPAARAEPALPAKGAPVQVPRITLSEEGEEALERIGRLCGRATSDAIENGSFQISERDLIRWADQSDDLVKNLKHYLMYERWSLKKAIDYEERMVDEETPLKQLLNLARARNGKITIEHKVANESWRIIIERISFDR